jgi:S-formylglutathione hydrolase
VQRVSRNKLFDGHQDVYVHESVALGCSMRFGVFLPKDVELGTCPILFFLSGLTCTEQNVLTKAGAQRYCAEHGVILVCPDTSPRGTDVPDDAADDLGQGAGFYVNAVASPWSQHFQMYDYITDELRTLVLSSFPSSLRVGISGHSMGGHGALVMALRNPELFVSVSAFAPIVAPTRCPWGQKAFNAYLGPSGDLWRQYDATELVTRSQTSLPLILIDQGTSDPFLTSQLNPALFVQACEVTGQPCELRMHDGYDHSYYFIASFIGEHVARHARALRA